MNTLDQIKKEYSQSKKYKSFDEMISKYVIDCKFKHIKNAFNEISTEYAKSCCEKSLKKASETAEINWHEVYDGTIDKNTIDNKENIIL